MSFLQSVIDRGISRDTIPIIAFLNKSIQVVLDDNELFYAVRNRSLPVDVSSDRLPVTTKENPSFHGYGLQNVQTTLAKYHSVYAMDYADGWFEFATDLPNTLIS